VTIKYHAISSAILKQCMNLTAASGRSVVGCNVPLGSGG